MAQRFAVVVGITGLFAIAFHVFLVLNPHEDMRGHIEYAATIHSIGDLRSPHFLFELSVLAWHSLGLSLHAATVAVLASCYGGMALLLIKEMERRRISLTGWRVALAVPAVLLASHVFLPTLLARNLYYGYFVPMAWHNPTQQLNKLFALWIYFAYAAEFLERDAPRAHRVAPIAALCVLSALAKPSFLIAFLPCVGVILLHDVWGHRWRQAGWAATLVVLIAAVLLWQSAGAFSREPGAAVSVIFAPFVVFEFAPTMYKLPASLLFPLVVWIAAIVSGWVDRRLLFLWAFTAVAFCWTLLAGEGGPRLMHGNFAWTGQTAVFLAYAESALLLMARPPAPPWRRSAWVSFGLHAACGLGWFALVFVPTRSTWL